MTADNRRRCTTKDSKPQTQSLAFNSFSKKAVQGQGSILALNVSLILFYRRRVGAR